MARYPLQPLLSVRKYREDAAQTRLRQAEHALQEALENLNTKEKKLADYQQWRREEEDRRYESIMNQMLSLDDLDLFKAGLARLREDEVLREEAVLTARQEHDRASQAVEDAKKNVHLAQRETARIVT
ncbi:MAG: YscO family type III secretion system apparatus protein, partial [Desulfovibrionales bacterium]|nr:YscO family type III secretion system apparatus protein [Desulfovibrionales bacterium]